MKNESFDQLAYARRIRRAGRPINIPEDDDERPCIPSDELRVCQTGDVYDSTVFDIHPAGTGIKILIIITSLKSKIAISSFELSLPWKQTLFWWLPDPLEIDGLSNDYRFAGRETLEFTRNSVLNHKLTLMYPISAGESVQGYLLGFGDPIPPKFRHGDMIPSFVIFYDQRGRQFPAPLELWADRSEKNLRPVRPGKKRKGGLFDKPDASRHREVLPGESRSPNR
jgi:hypothetical protein